MKSIILQKISLTTLALVAALAITARANGPRDLFPTAAQSHGNSVQQRLYPLVQEPAPGTLWYNGDFDGVNGLSNELNTSLGTDQFGSTYDDFIISDTGGWDVTALFSDNLADTGITGATWEIRQGISEGNGGTLIASGSTDAPIVTDTGRNGFGYEEFQVEVDGLSLHLDQGTYFLNVTVIGDLTGRSFDSTTVGANCVGTPCGNNANAWFNSNFFGANFTSTANEGVPGDFSMGVIGTVSGGGIVLEARGRRQGGNRFAVLQWSPADGGSVNVLRNGVVVGTTADDGRAQDNLGTNTGKFTYQVCETDTGDCSNEVAIFAH